MASFLGRLRSLDESTIRVATRLVLVFRVGLAMRVKSSKVASFLGSFGSLGEGAVRVTAWSVVTLGGWSVDAHAKEVSKSKAYLVLVSVTAMRGFAAHRCDFLDLLSREVGEVGWVGVGHDVVLLCVVLRDGMNC